MAEGIGSMAEIGPGGAYAGRVVGLIPALHALGTVGGIAASAAIHHRQKIKAIKEANDSGGFSVAGAQQGQTVQGP